MMHKILVVDDDPAILEILKIFLTKVGYEIVAVESGAQAIEKSKQESFSLVLCDVIMPEMDGIKTLSELKKINDSLPVIMMSGFSTHERIIKSFEKGAVDFIAKPISLLQVNKIIKMNLDAKLKGMPEYQSPISRLMRESNLALLNILITFQETKDPYFKGHARRVSEYAIKLAEYLTLPEGTIEVIKYAGELHDIGKIGVNDNILSKPDKLNQNEWLDIKTHPTIGRMMLEQLRLFRSEEPLVQYHHEWYDGRGYPDGLSKDAIPLGARIITIADAYAAMISPRSYRTAFTIPIAKQLMKDNMGTQFDPKLVEVFLNTV